MDKRQEINLLLKILNLKMEDFSLVAKLPVEVAKTLNRDKIQFEFNVGINVDLPKKQIVISMRVNFYAEEGKKNNIGHIKSRGIYEVGNIDDVVSKTNGRVPNTVLATLIGVTLSTTRGFFLLKSENTFMAGTMMPIMNPMSFFTPQVEAHATVKKS